MNNINEALRGYIDAILWAEAETDPDSPDYDLSWEDRGYCRGDVDRQSVADQKNQLEAFIAMAAERGLFAADTDWRQAGADFYFDRQGHGTGFWARPEVYGAEAAESLTAIIEEHFSEIYVCLDEEHHLVIDGYMRNLEA